MFTTIINCYKMYLGEVYMRTLSEQEIVRRNKLEETSKIVNTYPERYETNYEIFEVKDLEDGTKDVSVAGRIVLMRKMGKLSFLTIRDFKGKIQVSIKSDVVGEEKYEFFKDHFDIGDFIGVKGEVFTTHTGEKTIRAESFEFLGKALNPLPEKFHGLSDIELCYRNRYIDLIMNEDTRNKFMLRFEFIKLTRKYLEDLGYIEIETPILLNKASGALAKPFTTHHNALDIDVYLRIAPETYLKRAVIGGINKVFEIARCFRNEGMDSTHLQDFTMIEGYCAYFNYKDNMKLIKEMLIDTVKKLFNSTVIKIDNNEIDLNEEWKEKSFRELILEYTNIDITVYNSKEKLLSIIKEKNIDLESENDIELLGFGNLIDLLYKRKVRNNIIKPTFLVEHPIDLSPLARANDENPNITDRFQLIIAGNEIVNAYSELVDPIDQKERFDGQKSAKAGGEAEVMEGDDEFITSLEHGAPPISGWGMGIDRLVQLLLSKDNIKDTVLFPLLRPIVHEDEEKED